MNLFDRYEDEKKHNCFSCHCCGYEFNEEELDQIDSCPRCGAIEDIGEISIYYGGEY